MKSFEERLTRLEAINETINEGTIPLEEAVARFEEGIKIARGLETELAKIERKVEILVNQPESEAAVFSSPTSPRRPVSPISRRGSTPRRSGTRARSG